MIKKILAISICLFFVYTDLQAQRGTNYLSIGPSAGFPLNFDETYNIGAGAGFRGYLGAGPGAVLINLNVLSFDHKFNNRNLVLTSIKIGYSSRLRPSNLFVYGDVGGVADNRSRHELVPGLGFGVGYAIPVRNGGTVDIVPNFNAAIYPNGNRTWLDLHVAYRFAVRGRR